MRARIRYYDARTDEYIGQTVLDLDTGTVTSTGSGRQDAGLYVPRRGGGPPLTPADGIEWLTALKRYATGSYSYGVVDVLRESRLRRRARTTRINEEG